MKLKKVLEINNDLKELSYNEKREIVRILTKLTDEIRTQKENISHRGTENAEIIFFHLPLRLRQTLGPIYSANLYLSTLFISTSLHLIFATTCHNAFSIKLGMVNLRQGLRADTMIYLQFPSLDGKG